MRVVANFGDSRLPFAIDTAGIVERTSHRVTRPTDAAGAMTRESRWVVLFAMINIDERSLVFSQSDLKKMLTPRHARDRVNIPLINGPIRNRFEIEQIA